MHNIHLVGNGQPLDKFNIRSSVIVVGIFGVILLISYFNELARAGLLSKPRYAPSRNHITKRESGIDKVILQKDGNIHHLELDLKPLQSIIRGGNSSQTGDMDKQEINIKLHIGKNSSYLTQNNSSSLRIYQHQNSVSNFFLRFDIVMNGSVFSNNVTNSNRLIEMIARERKLTIPQNSTVVFMYQHEPGGYALRECLKRDADHQKLTISNVPLNIVYRNEWEKLPTREKSKFQILYGGLSFGACEGLDHTCSYSTFVLHPIDRILQVYVMCKKKSKSKCHLSPLDMTNTTVIDFIRKEGNNLFQKLLYYSRHCKLVGDDELCIHDEKAFFLLTVKEKAVYLENVLDNLPRWFRTVGLVKHWEESVALFDFSYGLNFTRCFGKMYQTMLPALKGIRHLKKPKNLYSFVSSRLQIDGKPYLKMREQLLNSTEVKTLLYADLAIYDKLEEIFKTQVQVYKSIQKAVSQKVLRMIVMTPDQPFTTRGLTNNTSSSKITALSEETGHKLHSKMEPKRKAHTDTLTNELKQSSVFDSTHSTHKIKKKREKKHHHKKNIEPTTNLYNVASHFKAGIKHPNIPEIQVQPGINIVSKTPNVSRKHRKQTSGRTVNTYMSLHE